MDRPTLTAVQARQLAGTTDQVFILGVRGFNAPKDANKRGVYDDALFIVNEDVVSGFNGNTDPSITKPGMAVLQPGDYDYRQGIHGIHHLDLNNAADKLLYDLLISSRRDLPPIPGRILPYYAFRQAGTVKLLRDGTTEPVMDGWPKSPAWIDIHDGGRWTTSSAGCQTVIRDQWPEFRTVGYGAMNAAGLTTISYKLRATD